MQSDALSLAGEESVNALRAWHAIFWCTHCRVFDRTQQAIHAPLFIPYCCCVDGALRRRQL